jgi:hypothetical protein
MSELKINIHQATDIIETVRRSLAERVSAEDIEKDLQQRFGISPIRKCEGEAHSNPFIDNCGVCMPRWGWAGMRVKVMGRINKVKA